MPARARDSKGRFVSKRKPKPKPKRKPRKKVPSSEPGVTVPVPKKGKKRTWQQALKVWNKNRDEWTIPKKGTDEYQEVKKLQG